MRVSAALENQYYPRPARSGQSGGHSAIFPKPFANRLLKANITSGSIRAIWLPWRGFFAEVVAWQTT